MSEWWTYRLSNFLLFSPRTYYRLFELYNSDPGRFPSLRQAARALTPELEQYGREELDAWLTTDDPSGRVYEWLLKADKQGRLKKA